MSFTKTFPYETGTIVKVPNEYGADEEIMLGSIACYNCVRDNDKDCTIVVSGLKEAWCGEYLQEDIAIATKEEIGTYCEKRGLEKEDIK